MNAPAAAAQKPISFWEFVFATGLVFADITALMLTAVYAVLVIPVMQYTLVLRAVPLDWFSVANLIAKMYLMTALYGFLCGAAFAMAAVFTRCKQAWLAMTIALLILLLAPLAPLHSLPPVWHWKLTVLLGAVSFITLTTFASWDIVNRRFFGMT